MKDYFDILNDYFGIFSASTELTGLLGTDPSDTAACDERLRKSFADSTLVTAEELPFVDFSFIGGGASTGNFLVLRPPIEFNVYCAGFYSASLIYKAITKLLKANYDDAEVSVGMQRGTVSGIYCFSWRVKAFVGS